MRYVEPGRYKMVLLTLNVITQRALYEIVEGPHDGVTVETTLAPLEIIPMLRTQGQVVLCELPQGAEEQS